MELTTFDDAYVRRLREGDSATEEHYFMYFNHFLGLRLRGKVPFSDIEDVLQDVHLRVLTYVRSGKEIRDCTRFGAFVFGFADNIVRERRRDHSTQALEDVYAADEDQLRDLIRKEKNTKVQRTLAAMKPRDAAIVSAVFIEERDKDEICRGFGVKRGYLRVLVYRALEKFREIFDDS